MSLYWFRWFFFIIIWQLILQITILLILRCLLHCCLLLILLGIFLSIFFSIFCFIFLSVFCRVLVILITKACCNLNVFDLLWGVFHSCWCLCLWRTADVIYSLMVLHFLDDFKVRFCPVIGGDVNIVKVWRLRSRWRCSPSTASKNTLPLLLLSTANLTTVQLVVADGTVLGKYSADFAIWAIWGVVCQCSDETTWRRRSGLQERATVFEVGGNATAWVCQSALLTNPEKLGVAFWKLVKLIIVTAVHDNFLGHRVSAD